MFKCIYLRDRKELVPGGRHRGINPARLRSGNASAPYPISLPQIYIRRDKQHATNSSNTARQSIIKRGPIKLQPYDLFQYQHHDSTRISQEIGQDDKESHVPPYLKTSDKPIERMPGHLNNIHQEILLDIPKYHQRDIRDKQYTSYSLSSSSEHLKMEPFLIAPQEGHVRVGRISAYGETQWGFGIMPDPQNFHCMLNENQAPQLTLVTFYLQIPFFKSPRQLRGLYIGQDYNRNPVARRILLVKESESAGMEDFLGRASGLIAPGELTPEQQAYYDYTCQPGDCIKMCTMPSLHMDESDLIKEKKMLAL